MKHREVGRIKNIKIDEETQVLELTVVIVDPKFKKKILRDLSLSGNLIVEDNKLIFLPETE